MSRRLAWTDSAWQEYLQWQSQDKRTLKRINRLIKDTRRSPFEGMGNRSLSVKTCQAISRDGLMKPIVWYMRWRMMLLLLFRVDITIRLQYSSSNLVFV